MHPGVARARGRPGRNGHAVRGASVSRGTLASTPARLLRIAVLSVALAAGLAAVVVGGYLGAALVGSLLVVGGPAPGDGPAVRRIYVYASPVHVDVVLPASDDVADWRGLIRSPAFPGTETERGRLAASASHVAFGRGAESFYFHVRTFDTLRPLLLADSVWDAGIVHATAVVAPEAVAGMIPLDVSERGYRRLVALLAGHLGTVPEPVPAQSYGARDGFFRTADPYSIVRTCNVWAAEVLAQAGVPMPLWSPFAIGVERAARNAAVRG